MGYDDGMNADDIARWERADAHFDILEDLALPLVEDVCRAALASDTVHRLAPRDGEMHRKAAFPGRGQVAFALGGLGGPGGGAAGRRLEALAVDLTSTLEDLLSGGESFRLTLVAALINDPDTVEIVHGLAGGIDYADDDVSELVRFRDGDYVCLDDVISVRVEA